MSEAEARAKAGTALGWLAGGSLGLLLNYGIFFVYGADYPTVPTTFVAFVAGAFGGMHLADRLGAKGFKLLAIAAGVIFAVTVGVVLTVLLAGNR